MRLLKSLLAAAASIALVTAAHAAPPAGPPVNVRFANVERGDYLVEPSHTRILFSVSHLGFTTWYGDFSHAAGTARIDPSHPAASRVEVRVPSDSVSTTNQVLDGELKSPDWFDAGRFPAITFTSRKLTVSGPNRGEIAGDLTLHGVTRPVTLQVRFNGSGANPMDKVYTAGFEAVGKIKRSDFGVAKYVPLVGDEVTLIISAAFTRKPS
ncbi:MAG TPA: YceI family protein [Caulobacteraceae bacterium]